MKRPTILSVDDSEDDNFLLRRAFEKAEGDPLHLELVHDGEEAIDYFLEAGNARRPDLVLLDLKMPGQDGFTILEWLDRQPGLADLRIAVFSSSHSVDEVNRAYQSGATWYFVKPIGMDALVELSGAFKRWIETRDSTCLTSSPYFRAPDESA